MADFGIICEFNPIHNGHVHLINEAKLRGAERIVCVMSGNAVQRGELAIADKYTRAEMAIRSGADLVLELPYPYSASSAEYFARAGVRVLSDLADNIIFGSECGDIGFLKGAARAAMNTELRTTVKERVQHGEGAASVYFSELEKRGFGGLSSNDILGIEYIRAIYEKELDTGLHTVKRSGAAYNDAELSGGEYPSATALRRLLSENTDAEGLSEFMPKEAAELILSAKKNGELTDSRELDSAVLAFFRLHSPSDFENIAEAGGGLSGRICALAGECVSANELFDSLRTKKYTDARIRRAMLFCLTGVTRELLDSPPEYTTLLGATAKGRELLARKRRAEKIWVVTKPADAPTCAQRAASERLDALFTLARAKKAGVASSFAKKAYIEY